MEVIFDYKLTKIEKQRVAKKIEENPYCSCRYVDMDPNGDIGTCNGQFLKIGNLFDSKDIFSENIKLCNNPLAFRCTSCANNAVSNDPEELLEFLNSLDISNEINIKRSK